ncbi:MAG: AbrB/MazE/SpoVT family DNA-binding domain-containing protein [Terriglobales bacterium]
MHTRLIIDKAGRVVIPKPLRKQLQLEPGDALELESGGEQITLRPARGTGPLQNEHGIWVLHTGEPLSASVTDDLLRRIRDERDSANLGDGFVENGWSGSIKPPHRAKSKAKSRAKK